MVKLFGDYQDKILQTYKEKVAANDLSPRLTRPTPAELKKECIAVCSERYNKRDDHTLRTFFEKSGDQEICLQAIEDLDIDRYRPLINFLREDTSEPKEKIVELLAWLIDFKPRPFELWKKHSYVDDVQSPPGQQLSKPGDPPEDEPIKKPTLIPKDSGKPDSNPKRKIIILTVIIAMAASLIIFWPTGRKASLPALTGNEKCMYWKGDHYEQVSCNQKMGDVLVIGLDSEKLNYFRKITQPDTITSRAIGTVWYVKVKGTIEFYTGDGFHPIAIQLRLRPITDYIINKYISKNN